MKPAARRRVEREINKIMEADGEHCTICNAVLQHNSRTFGGVSKTGTPSLTGECCQGKLKEIVLMGLYLTRDADDLSRSSPAGGTASPSDIHKAVEVVQGIFASREVASNAISARAGFSTPAASIFRQKSDWKRDDADWFEANPTRSHRLRRLIGDEAKISGFEGHFTMPPNHELQILVRQVEPGARARVPFGRNLAVPIPDDETVLHALFDLVKQGHEGGSATISTKAVMRAVDQHSRGGGSTN